MLNLSSLATHSSRQNSVRKERLIHGSPLLCSAVYTVCTYWSLHKLPPFPSSFPPFSSRRSTSLIIDVRGVLKTTTATTAMARKESRRRPRRPPPLSTFTWSPSPRCSPSPPPASWISSPPQGAPLIRFRLRFNLSSLLKWEHPDKRQTLTNICINGQPPYCRDRGDLDSVVTRLSALYISAAISGLILVPGMLTSTAASVTPRRLHVLQASCLFFGVLPFLGLNLCPTPLVPPALSFVLFGLV